MDTSIILYFIILKIVYWWDRFVDLKKDLAEFYQTETRTLKQSVKRNIDRFPENFRFQLTEYEFKNLRSQFVIPKQFQTN